jgi:hypothetical protein
LKSIFCCCLFRRLWKIAFEGGKIELVFHSWWRKIFSLENSTNWKIFSWWKNIWRKTVEGGENRGGIKIYELITLIWIINEKCSRLSSAWKFIFLSSISSSFSQYNNNRILFSNFRYGIEAFLIIIWKACGGVDATESSVIKSTFCGVYTRHSTLGVDVSRALFFWENVSQWEIQASQKIIFD